MGPVKTESIGDAAVLQYSKVVENMERDVSCVWKWSKTPQRFTPLKLEQAKATQSSQTSSTARNGRLISNSTL